ncbi:hypothetical protein HC752_21780 [Vibrio sp. S9_S30]|uniref:hypothetical protein n=1 Tax=Vibrio sp. S9_S30 TaxID=2720226 RepID=UPI00167FF587|nr:hypothetical protein [Vibrio sp. S9_S30]MBD1559577.1 hypothetical protein [Vibrio sp. S9_S30]
MPAIRYTHNYRNVVLNERGAIQGSGVSGDRLPALSKDGEHKFKSFGGFLPLDFDTKQHQLVKLVGVNGFTHDDDGLTDWENLPPNHYCVGCYLNDEYYLLLENQFPITRPLEPQIKKTGEVVPFPKKS